MKIRIVVLGKQGQIGRELVRTLAQLGDVFPIGRNDCNICDDRNLRQLLHSIRPQIIVNAAAYTAVDKAESEPAEALAVNSAAVGNIASTAQELGALLIHYSTDYVFSGDKIAPYLEDDGAVPLSVYGSTKLAGEEQIRARCNAHLIFRTSWVYSNFSRNFLKTMVTAMLGQGSIRVIDDQHGTPTSAALIAKVTAEISEKYLSSLERRLPFNFGTYHLTASGSTTWYAYAVLIGTILRDLGVSLVIQPEDIRSINSIEFPTAARRPLNSRLDTSKLQNAFDLSLPAWEKDVHSVVSQLVSLQR